ncbi:hypothetical protein GCM10009789_40260 [Kribbella sancticallisti]|uniref:Uncharacterized protein n=1 Tax=Kribbella sancticallisti TaxID=460087 RepID=A0ABN2DSJ2_9ACTN
MHETFGRLYDETQIALMTSPDGYKTPGMPPRPGYLEGVMETLKRARLHGPHPRPAGLAATA